MLNDQLVGKTRYVDAAGFPGRTVGLSDGDSVCLEIGANNDAGGALQRRGTIMFQYTRRAPDHDAARRLNCRAWWCRLRIDLPR